MNVPLLGGAISPVTITSGTQISDLKPDEQNTLDKLIRQYMQKLSRNKIRQMYYDSKNLIKDLGIAIPPEMVNIEMVLGWPAKAVDGLARRNKMDGFVIPGGSSMDMGIDAMWNANDMDIEAPQAHTSAYIHSCAFVATTKGDVASGEPDVLITTRSAMSGTALWDRRRRRLSAHLAIVDTSEDGTPTVLMMYLPDVVITMTRFTLGWKVERRKHSLGRLPVELLVHKPNLERPFGASRISRPVMGLADAALRTAVRMEVSAEFYSSPQRWIMGADESMFMDAEGNLKTQWQAIMGRLWAAGRTEEGELPQVGTFAAASPQPHSDQLRTLATQFSGETSIPVGSLGVIQENASSAEAIHAMKEDLLIEAEYCNQVFGTTWVRAVLTGLQIRENRDTIPDEWRSLRTKWRNPATMSQSSAGDFALKLIQAYPKLQDSAVGLEMMGWDETTVARAMADMQRAQLGSRVDGMINAARQVTDLNVIALASKRTPDEGEPDALAE
ncbi:phage portal protein [Rhodococcus sp. BH5]|uniref:phage portal protein n=1 Tax=Rhodococcus sp. BH5 TaxID=2871702 RepID=UPI0022CD2157|nr:phage portal protein [Rhodococcus sp. BH5]MCZ9635148.1 phage portal protein [Rhodococcus sp. BH5]